MALTNSFYSVKIEEQEVIFCNRYLHEPCKFQLFRLNQYEATASRTKPSSLGRSETKNIKKKILKSVEYTLKKTVFYRTPKKGSVDDENLPNVPKVSKTR